MRFDVPSLATHRLLARPETGMGYQVIKLNKDIDDISYVLVENATVARAVWTVRESAPFTLSRKSWISVDSEERIQEAMTEWQFMTLSHASAASRGFVLRKARDGGVPASEAEQESSEPYERFIRFSAFSNDRRILADGSLLPNTYATTHADGISVKSGMEAVRRYALPSEDPATHRYFLRPPTQVLLRRGTVTPANGQPGGGAEVLFDDGAPPGTLYDYNNNLPPGE